MRLNDLEDTLIVQIYLENSGTFFLAVKKYVKLRLFVKYYFTISKLEEISWILDTEEDTSQIQEIIGRLN